MAGMNTLCLSALPPPRYLTFNAMRIVDGKYIPASTTVIEFKRLMKSQFGHPNDEALRGRPLASETATFNFILLN